MFSRFLRISSILVVSLGVGSSSAIADILINNFTDATNDQFTNNSAFIGNPYSFSGVGRMPGVDPSASSPAFRWATMISSNVALSAAHSHPGVNDIVRFYPGNDPGGAYVERTVIGGQKVGSSDLFALIFDSPMPSSFTVYDFATESLSGNGAAGTFQNELAFMMGKSPTTNSNTAFDQAVGQNRITGYLENVDFGGNTDNDAIILEYNDSSDPEYTLYESRVVSGDSGAPMFVVRDGKLLLLGINSFTLTGSNPPFSGSGITYTGNLVAELNAIIVANAVPEPSSIVLLGLISLSLITKRRRRFSGVVRSASQKG